MNNSIVILTSKERKTFDEVAMSNENKSVKSRLKDQCIGVSKYGLCTKLKNQEELTKVNFTVPSECMKKL